MTLFSNTCDIYRSGNLPPDDPDVAAIPCQLTGSYKKSRRLGGTSDLRFTNMLDVPVHTDIRDASVGWLITPGDSVYIPHKNGVGYDVLFVETHQHGQHFYKRAYLNRRALSWPYPRGLLVHHWRFNEGSGSIIYDSGSTTHLGTLQGAVYSTDVPSALANKRLYSLQFAGAGSNVSFGNLDIRQFSVSVWLKRASLSQRDFALMRSQEADGWSLYVDRTDFDTHSIVLCKEGVGSVQATFLIDDLAWHHLVVTHDSELALFYVDGSLVTTATFIAGFGSGGNYHIGNNTTHGNMTDFRIYQRFLLSTEIGTLFTGADVL